MSYAKPEWKLATLFRRYPARWLIIIVATVLVVFILNSPQVEKERRFSTREAWYDGFGTMSGPAHYSHSGAQGVLVYVTFHDEWNQQLERQALFDAITQCRSEFTTSYHKHHIHIYDKKDVPWRPENVIIILHNIPSESDSGEYQRTNKWFTEDVKCGFIVSADTLFSRILSSEEVIPHAFRDPIPVHYEFPPEPITPVPVYDIIDRAKES